MKRQAKLLARPETLPDSPVSLPLPAATFPLESEADTARLAAAFAAHLGAGDVLLLTGGLAAGKTTFTRAFVAALGATDTVSSPTYTLVNLYNSARPLVLHMDAYRIESVAEFYDLALEDELETRISLIEWGAKLADEFDETFQLDLQMADQSGARIATVSASGIAAQATLPAILSHFHKGAP